MSLSGPLCSILNFNKSFLALLHSRLRENGPAASIGELFIGMVSLPAHCLLNFRGVCSLLFQFTQAHKSMYAIYCSNYDSAELYVTRLRKRKEFEQALLVYA